jgi:hypothetical protein
MVLLYMVTFTINTPPMLAYIPYMDPMGKDFHKWWYPNSWMVYYGRSIKKNG